MPKKVGVQSVTPLKTAQSGREYFTFDDFEQTTHVCFIPQLKDYCKAGSEIEADISPGKSPSDSPRLDNIYIDGKPVFQPPSKATGRSYGKSKEELAQQRQLAEATRRSIEAQTALNRAVDLAMAGYYLEFNADHKTVKIDKLLELAETFYRKLQSLTQISEAEVIDHAIRASIETKGNQEIPSNETEGGETSKRTIKSSKADLQRLEGTMVIYHYDKPAIKELCAELNLPQDSAELTKAQIDTLINAMKAEKK